MFPKLISTSISQCITGKLFTCGLPECCTDQKGRSIFFKSLWRIMKANERRSNWIQSQRITIWCWTFSLLLVNFLFRILCSQAYFGWVDSNNNSGYRCTMKVSSKSNFLRVFKLVFPWWAKRTLRNNFMMPLMNSLELNFLNLLHSCNMKYHNEFIFYITVWLYATYNFQ